MMVVKLMPNCGKINMFKPRRCMTNETRVPTRKWNSLWSSDTIWRQRSGSTSAQVKACCLTAPSHCLNQCWLIINKVQRHSSEAISQAISQSRIPKISLKINYLKFHSDLPGANELKQRKRQLWPLGSDPMELWLWGKLTNMKNANILLLTTSITYYSSDCLNFGCNPFKLHVRKLVAHPRELLSIFV